MANAMIYGLIGEKLSHSMSRIIHQQLGGYDYQLMPLNKEQLADFFACNKIGGINVTIPYKQAVIAFCDRLDTSAQEIGAVNTIITQNGQRVGYNTDFFGLKTLILDSKIAISGAKVLILGTGGTAKTAAAVCKNLGAGEIFFATRKENVKAHVGLQANVISYQQAKQQSPQVIINTTPCGMYPDINDQPVDLRDFQGVCGVIDVVYNPLKTRLVMQAEQLGIRAAGGLKMLVYQAVLASELFTGKKISPQLANGVHSIIKKTMQNIVLIGMPGSGKSVIGKAIAKQLCRSFYDIDEEIERSAGKRCSDIILNQGEASFRTLEHDACARIAAKTGVVISTGGGCVKTAENIKLLSQNGIIIYIKRATESLSLEGRPLSQGGALERLYSERAPLYEQFADAVFDNDSDLETITDKISARFY